MARKTSLTSSVYVTGNICKKARGRWIEASREIGGPEIGEMDDEELGLTLKACNRVRQNAKNALNKLNQQGGKNTWTRHMTNQKNVLTKQIDAADHVHALLSTEADLREQCEEEPEVPKEKSDKEWEQYAKEVPPPVVEESVDQADPVPQEFTEPAGANLFELFQDTPQKELMELAYKGLEAGKSEISPEELANLREDVKVTKALCEELQQKADTKQEMLEDARKLAKRLKVENKKLRKVLKGIQTESRNTANRLKKYVETKETTK